MLARKRREMRKWAESNIRNKKSLQPTYIKETPKDHINCKYRKNTPCPPFFSYGPPPQNYSRKTLVPCNKSNDMKVSKCDLKKTNFEIKNSIIKRIDNKNGIHNPCYYHTSEKYLEGRNKQFMEHPEEIKQKKYRENCKTSFCNKSKPVCNRIQFNRYSNPKYSKSESVSSGARLNRLKHQVINKTQQTNRLSNQNVMNGMYPISLYKPTGPTKTVTELPTCNKKDNTKPYCEKTPKWCKPPCKCECK